MEKGFLNVTSASKVTKSTSKLSDGDLKGVLQLIWPVKLVGV